MLQKLDAGIDHILVDEAQDTSAAQWDILDRISEDFFAGEGQSSRARSFFAVGDEKQSIFSFQGAEPRLFAQKKSEYENKVLAAQEPFEPVELTLSFRSAPGVLEAVDKVFSFPEHFRGLSAQEDNLRTVASGLEMRRAVARRNLGRDRAGRQRGAARLAAAARFPRRGRSACRGGAAHCGNHSPVAAAGFGRDGHGKWRAPPDPSRRHHDSRAPPRRLFRGDDPGPARKERAGCWRRPAEARRAYRGDGSRRASAARRWLPEDDLTLATALKTPIFGFDDDDLIRLAPQRTGSLHDALRGSTGHKDQTACALLDLLRRMGRELPPFAFYTRLLGPRGGRRAFLARLGPEAGDALDEFLNLALAHERARAPSLAAFLAEVAGLDVSIKRDMDLTSSFVRVMTVHAAKGLEAKIVFLPDVCSAPVGNHDGALFPLAAPNGDTLIAWSPKKDFDCAVVAAARAARRRAAGEEYRRLLYVAMTRAEERLVIAGHRGARAFSPESWRGFVEASLLEGASEAPAPWGGEGKVLRFGPPETAPPAPLAVVAPAPDQAAGPAPAWLFAPAPAENPAAPPLRPSSALDGADPAPPTSAHSPQRAQALEEGRLAHRLLQFLPDLPAAARREAALRDLAAQGLSAERAEKLAGAVLAILGDPRLAPLFGENSIAEARVAARVKRPGGGLVAIAGALDRLAETPDGLWLADYKTGAARAESRPAYVAQLALYRAAVAQLYPGRPVRCFLIYAAGPKVSEITEGELDAALDAALSDSRGAN